MKSRVDLGHGFSCYDSLNYRWFFWLCISIILDVTLHNFIVPDTVKACVTNSTIQKVLNSYAVLRYSFAEVPIFYKGILNKILGLIFILNQLKRKIYQPVVMLFKKNIQI